MTKTEERTAQKQLERDAKNERNNEKLSARRERDEKLTEINKKYEKLISDLRTEAHTERGKVWDAWRERRAETSE